MFGFLKKKKANRVGIFNVPKLNYTSWNSFGIFNELKEDSEETHKKILDEFELISDDDIKIIKSLGFNRNVDEYSPNILNKLKSIIDDGGVLIKKSSILKISRSYNMTFMQANEYRGKLSPTNIKDIVKIKNSIDKWSSDFKYYSKVTHNPPPNTSWIEIVEGDYNVWPTIKAYKKEPILHILEKENSDKIIFVSVVRNDIYVPLTYIKSERKSKIDDVLED